MLEDQELDKKKQKQEKKEESKKTLKTVIISVICTLLFVVILLLLVILGMKRCAPINNVDTNTLMVSIMKIINIMFITIKNI